MTRSLLELVQDATDELGIARPAAVVTTSDQQTLQLLALTTRCGQMLSAHTNWTALTKLLVVPLLAPTDTTGDTTDASAVITAIPSTTGMSVAYSVTGTGIPTGARVLTVDSATQVTLDMPCTASGTAAALSFAKDTYDLPAGYRAVAPSTQWDRTNAWPLQGPVSPQQYQWLISGNVATGPRRKFRLQGQKMVVWPAPTSADTLVTEYLSSYWVTTSAGVAKARFTLDSDLTLFDDDLMIMGLKWLFFQAKGFEYTELRRQWLSQVSIAAASDGGAQTLDMTGARGWRSLGVANVPETGFGA